MYHMYCNNAGPGSTFDSRDVHYRKTVIKFVVEFLKEFLGKCIAKISDLWEGLTQQKILLNSKQ